MNGARRVMTAMMFGVAALIFATSFVPGSGWLQVSWFCLEAGMFIGWFLRSHGERADREQRERSGSDG